jgi:hypothetical protein
MAVTSCLREFQTSEDIRRITFHARTTTRAVRHELHTALELPGQPPRYATEFDHLLKATLATHPHPWYSGHAVDGGDAGGGPLLLQLGHDGRGRFPRRRR